MRDADRAYVIALVWAWLAEHPEHYCSWVKPFLQLRWSPSEQRMLATRVGGHYQRLAQWARVIPALNCTCKFERLTQPAVLSTPETPIRLRWNENGDFIPRRYRALVWA